MIFEAKSPAKADDTNKNTEINRIFFIKASLNSKEL